MPKVATAPLPLSQAASARPRSRGREAAVYPRSTESRVSALEARWEETTPTLATRADLRGEIRGVEIRLIKWIFGAAAGVLLALGGVVNSLHSRIDSSNAELRAEIRDTNVRIDSAIAELRAEIRATNERMDARFEKMDEKFEKMDAKMDAVLEVLRALRSEAAAR